MNLRRASATSGRPCSVACRLFFDGDPVAFEEPPDRRLADANAMPGRQFRADLGQRQVRLMSDKRQDRLAMPTQARAMVTTHWSGARLTLGTPPLRIAVLSLTPNRSAAARAELPAATAAVKRSLKSCDNGPGIFPTVTVILQTADSQTFRPM